MTGLLAQSTVKNRSLISSRVIGHKMAHAVGLVVIAYTFREEEGFVYPSFNGDVRAEIDFCLQLGPDGFFMDFPDAGISQRNEWIKGNNK